MVCLFGGTFGYFIVSFFYSMHSLLPGLKSTKCQKWSRNLEQTVLYLPGLKIDKYVLSAPGSGVLTHQFLFWFKLLPSMYFWFAHESSNQVCIKLPFQMINSLCSQFQGNKQGPWSDYFSNIRINCLAQQIRKPTILSQSTKNKDLLSFQFQGVWLQPSVKCSLSL